MSSPFKTPQEFLEVEGPLYTFANSPIWLTIFLILSTIIFLWFIFASYKMKSSSNAGSDPAMMSILILTGFLSLAQSIYVAGTTAIEVYLQRNKSTVSMSKNVRTPIRKVSRRTHAKKQYHSRRSQRGQIRQG